MDTEKYLQTMIANMPEKTGKSLDTWKKILTKKNFAKHGEAMKFLKEEHKVTHGFANTIIALSKEEEKPSESDLVADQYNGKENLKPIYDGLKRNILALGKDIEVSPKKAAVSFIRKRQFALVKPATKSRIDLGLKLPGVSTCKRLQDSGPFGTMCTHRVQLACVKELDAELKGWLLQAYNLAD